MEGVGLPVPQLRLLPEREVVSYPRLWLRGVRRESGHTLRTLSLALPGLLVGWWLTDGWVSAWAATWVSGLCSLGAVAAGHLTWQLANQLRERRPDPPPRLAPVILRHQLALVTPAHRAHPWQSGMLTVLVGVGFWFALAAATVRAPDLRPDQVEALLAVVGLCSLNMLSVMGAALGPRVALCPDRLEIRRGLGRHVIPWSAVAAVGAPDGRLVVFLGRPGSTSRRGWVRRHSGYAVPIRDPGMPISTLSDAIEGYRRRHAAGAPPAPGTGSVR